VAAIMIDQAVMEIEPLIGTCRRAARSVPRAPRCTGGARRWRGFAGRDRRRPEQLHSPRFVDASPAEVWATLLDEGTYLASQRTMYRILAAEHGGVRERRARLQHPAYSKPELLADTPNCVWPWTSPSSRVRRSGPTSRCT
jgi:hypothetical protein